MFPEDDANSGSRVAPEPESDRANFLGVAAMTGSMAAFVINDVCVKLASQTLPIGEIITLRNVVATVVLFALMGLASGIWGRLVWPRRIPYVLVGLRVGGEMVATILFLVALVTLPLADLTAITQLAPLALTAAAALLFGEYVGWRRWTATAAGFLGVALIVRPGSAAFSLAGAMVLLSVAFVVVSDMATRLIARDVSSAFISLTSSLSGIFAGFLLLPFEVWRVPSSSEAGLVFVSGFFLSIGFSLIVIALRTGDISVVSPFRYSVILFALIAGFVVWGERPDFVALVGIVIICSAGLYTLHRERVRQRMQRASGPLP